MMLYTKTLNGKNYNFICEYKNTRSGFKHECTVLNSANVQIGFAKICYMNRTWESYTFQTVLKKAARVAGLDALADEF